MSKKESNIRNKIADKDDIYEVSEGDIKDTRTQEEIDIEAERLEYAMQLGLIGDFDDEDNIDKIFDKDEAFDLVMDGKTVPDDLMQRILKYKEDEDKKWREFAEGGYNVSNIMIYKGYIGSVEFCGNDKMLYGQVLGISELIDYKGSSVDEIRADFERKIDEHIETDREHGNVEQYYGSNVISIQLDVATIIKIKRLARKEHKTANEFIVQCLKEKLLDYKSKA